MPAAGLPVALDLRFYQTTSDCPCRLSAAVGIVSGARIVGFAQSVNIGMHLFINVLPLARARQLLLAIVIVHLGLATGPERKFKD